MNSGHRQVKIVVSVLIIMLGSVLQTSGDDNIRFNHITVEQGLSQSTVYAIIQDRYGFMWFGTRSGLNRYDGYNFSVYQHNPPDPQSLSHNLINCLMEDSDGILWIGTNGGGLNRFDRDTDSFTHFRHDPGDPSSISHDMIRAITQDNLGRYWIGTYRGLNRFNPKTGKAIRYLHDPTDRSSLSHNEVMRIYADSDGKLWVGTVNGLNRLDPETGRFDRFFNNPDDSNSLNDNFIESILEDHDGILWVGTQKGVNRYDPKTGLFTHYSKDPEDVFAANIINTIVEDSRNNLWIGVAVGGLKRLDRDSGRFTHYRPDPQNPYSIGDVGIASIYEDTGGVVWLGLSQHGVDRFDPYSEKFDIIRHDSQNPQSLDSNTVHAFWEDRQGLFWIGTASATGLNRTDSTMKAFDHFGFVPDNPDSLSSMAVMSMLEDHLGMFWIGTYGGLDLFDRQKGKFIHYLHNPDDPFSISSEQVKTLYEDKSGMLWIGTDGGGLNRFDRATQRFIRYQHNPDDPESISDINVTNLFEDSANLFWVCTDNGVCTLDRASGKFQRYPPDLTDPKKIGSRLVSTICESPPGVLWFGTDKGLNKYDKSSATFIKYGKQHGLGNENIAGILEDDKGRLWLSTGRGISVFDPKTEKFRNFDLSDGLQGLEFMSGALLKTRDGRMLFGGMNGFNLFHPDQVVDNPYIPRIVITDFQLFNESVKPSPDSVLSRPIYKTDKITLSHTDDVFSFEFASLSYAHPEKNLYAYMLEGFETDWNYSNHRRFATYTNLPAGSYTFRVKGSNNDGVWNEDGTSLDIKVLPPPWKTWWAYSLYGVDIFAVLFTFYRYMKRKVETAERMRRMEEQLHQARKMESLGQLAGGIAHDFNNILSSVIGFSQFALKHEITSDSEARDSLEEILKAGYRAQDIVQGILTFSRKTEADKKAVKLSEVIAEVLKFLRASIPKSIRIHLRIGAHADTIWASPSQMAQVVMNLCTNAEHAMRGDVGELTIISDTTVPDTDSTTNPLIVKPGKYVRLTIKDTGCGMEPEVMKQIFEPYFTTKAVGEGTGFGLAVVHGIIADHEGDIRVSGKPGQGTKFEILLPLYEDEIKEKRQDQGPLPQGNERILLIDDEEQVIKYHWKLLTKLGYRVTPANQSTKGYEIFKSDPHEFDLIITDQTMPAMTGIEIARKAKKIRENIPIILYTGYMGLITETQTQTIGIDLILTKPVDDREMAVKIRNVLDCDG